MARNLYDLGDRAPDPSGAWLHDTQESRTRIVPVGIILVALLMAGVAILLFKDILPAPGGTSSAAGPMTISERFATCDDLTGGACVLSADSYAYKGRRYRVADISVPSQTDAQCPAEAELAQQGRAALAAMMNGGAFDARPDPVDPDPSAKLLVRDGVSLGQLMILKGHAQPWSPKPINWCAGEDN
jgi:hypothetical protein